ncbi:hypothetical protein [uncultured Kordia sp.]|uniref:hypothetical protein n=1 Tax=uncultured Kordia sp. TaxID=507699 RepID=UPI00260D44B5|nr:hypothetical protein [uncultured Kordia sp.]
MKNRIVILTFLCALAFSSFKVGDATEKFGKQFFKLLKASPKASEADIKTQFISLQELRTFPKTELAELSQEQFNGFIQENIDNLKESLKDFGIVCNEIKYVKTEIQSAKEKDIDIKKIDIYFEHGVRYFVLKLITIPYQNQLKLVYIMPITYAEE